MKSDAHYDTMTIRLHWLTAILIVVQWVGAHLIDEFPKGPLRIDAQSFHITVGVTLGVLVLFRLYWRATSGRRLPDSGTGLLPLLARLMHWALYLLVLAVVGLGLTMISLHEVNLYNLVTLPGLVAGTRPFLRTVHGLHELGANAILIGMFLHGAAAIVHQYVWRDGVLARMVPRLG